MSARRESARPQAGDDAKAAAAPPAQTDVRRPFARYTTPPSGGKRPRIAADCLAGDADRTVELPITREIREPWPSDKTKIHACFVRHSPIPESTVLASKSDQTLHVFAESLDNTRCPDRFHHHPVDNEDSGCSDSQRPGSFTPDLSFIAIRGREIDHGENYCRSNEQGLACWHLKPQYLVQFLGTEYVPVFSSTVIHDDAVPATVRLLPACRYQGYLLSGTKRNVDPFELDVLLTTIFGFDPEFVVRNRG